MLFQLFSLAKKKETAFQWDISDFTIYVETVQESYGNNY